MSAVKEGVD